MPTTVLDPRDLAMSKGDIVSCLSVPREGFKMFYFSFDFSHGVQQLNKTGYFCKLQYFKFIILDKIVI